MEGQKKKKEKEKTNKQTNVMLETLRVYIL